MSGEDLTNDEVNYLESRMFEKVFQGLYRDCVRIMIPLRDLEHWL
jgi:hypothetical protein